MFQVVSKMSGDISEISQGRSEIPGDGTEVGRDTGKISQDILLRSPAASEISPDILPRSQGRTEMSQATRLRSGDISKPASDISLPAKYISAPAEYISLPAEDFFPLTRQTSVRSWDNPELIIVMPAPFSDRRLLFFKGFRFIDFFLPGYESLRGGWCRAKTKLSLCAAAAKIRPHD